MAMSALMPIARAQDHVLRGSEALKPRLLT